MQNLWTPKDQRLLERLKYDIVTGPALERPDLSRKCYINTDYSKYDMGVVLLQVDESLEARKSDAQEKADGKCEF